ncbi:hypothetical protein, partial [Candidatus Nitrosarchaeum limnium]
MQRIIQEEHNHNIKYNKLRDDLIKNSYIDNVLNELNADKEFQEVKNQIMLENVRNHKTDEILEIQLVGYVIEKNPKLIERAINVLYKSYGNSEEFNNVFSEYSIENMGPTQISLNEFESDHKIKSIKDLQFTDKEISDKMPQIKESNSKELKEFSNPDKVKSLYSKIKESEKEFKIKKIDNPEIFNPNSCDPKFEYCRILKQEQQSEINTKFLDDD